VSWGAKHDVQSNKGQLKVKPDWWAHKQTVARDAPATAEEVSSCACNLSTNDEEGVAQKFKEQPGWGRDPGKGVVMGCPRKKNQPWKFLKKGTFFNGL